MSSDLKKIGKTSSLMFIGKVLEASLMILFNMLVVRLLGASAYGKFIYVFTLIQIIAIIAKLGLERGIMAFIPRFQELKEHNKVNSFISFTLYSTTLLSVLLVAILISFRGTIAKFVLNDLSLTSTLLILAPILLFVNFMNISLGIFRSLEKIKYYILSRNIIMPITMLVMLLILYYIFKQSIICIILCYYIAWGLGCSYLLLILLKRGNVTSIKSSDFHELIQLLKFSSPLLLSTFLSFLMSKLDCLMLGYYLEDSKVGIYNIAFQIAMMSSFVLASFNTMLAPKISLYYSTGKLASLGNLYKGITRWVAAINLVFFSLIFILSKDLMALFGSEFISASWVLVIISAGQVVNAGVGSVGDMNTLTGRPHYELYTIVIGLIVNATLNFFLIPTYGILGAAIASFVTASSVNLLRLLLMYKNLNIHPFTINYLKVVIISLVSLVVVYFIKEIIYFNYFINIILFSILYIIIFIWLLYLIGITEDDKEILSPLLRKFNIYI